MRLLESIQILEGDVQRLDYHNERMNKSRRDLFCCVDDLFLEEYINLPDDLKFGKIKCRISYHHEILNVSYFEYEPHPIESFYLVPSEIDYSYKYADRSKFEELKNRLPDQSEIIIVKNGEITDTSYSNLIFLGKNGKWYTPLNPLLKGTQREYLLDEGIIEEKLIRPEDLKDFSHLMMINAMLDFDESRKKDINSINL